MKAFIALAVAMTGAPALAASGSDDQTSASRSDRKICTRVERRGGSRLAYQRVCLTESEWMDQLGPDWRIRLSGRSPDDDLDAMSARSRDFSNIGTGGLGGEGAAQTGRPGGLGQPPR